MDEELIRSITSAATEVHHLLGGPGLLETIYEAALCHELSLRGIPSQRQLAIPVVYKSAPVREPMFLDILVEGRLIIEVKATGKDYPIYHAQLSTYMRLTGVKLGLLINFGKQSIQDGIIQMIDK
ncbi:MAG: GxxExxY protein [Chlamydiales bacterium]|nr:GxxExxY protein [Chlamydiales bacterium]